MASSMVEFWTRHGNHLGMVQGLNDATYLEEPFVRTTDWLSNPGQNLANPVPFDTVDELGTSRSAGCPAFRWGPFTAISRTSSREDRQH